MKSNAERLYWSVVGFMVMVTIADTALILWSTFVKAMGDPLWRDLVSVPASWLLPHALMSGALSLMWLAPELSLYAIRAAIAVLTLTTLALPAWFYASRRATLRLRWMALVGVVVVAVAVRSLFQLLP